MTEIMVKQEKIKVVLKRLLFQAVEKITDRKLDEDEVHGGPGYTSVQEAFLQVCDSLDPAEKSAPFRPRNLLDEQSLDQYACLLNTSAKELSNCIKELKKEETND